MTLTRKDRELLSQTIKSIEKDFKTTVRRVSKVLPSHSDLGFIEIYDSNEVCYKLLTFKKNEAFNYMIELYRYTVEELDL